MSQKARKITFYCMAAVAFLAVTIYEFLTPYMSDDIIYGDTVATAGSIFDLFRQEAEHYISHSGRSVAHIILRFFLYFGHKSIFNVVSGAVFVLLSILIYSNVRGKKDYDIKIYACVLAMLWFLDPAIANTVFWASGTCNYLYTTTIIMTFVTIYRRNIDNDNKKSVLLTIGMFVLGVAAGWCNENTSGGLILFVLIELFYHFIISKKSFKFVKPWMISGLAGSLFGFVMLLLSPGNYNRLDATDEEHTGLLAMAARFLKITLNIKDNYFILVAIFAVIVVLLIYLSGKDSYFYASIKSMSLFGVLFLATCYALIMVPSSELRSYYGASIFLMTGIAQGVAALENTKEELISAGISAVLVVACLMFLLAYFDDGANLARIKREFDERDAYLTELASQGADDVYAPMLRPLWETRFSVAYEADIEEDWQFWINFFTAQHYGLGTIHGVDREEWTEY